MKKIFVLCFDTGTVTCVNSLSCVWHLLPSVPLYVNEKQVISRSSFFNLVKELHVFTMRAGSLGKVKVFRSTVLTSKTI
jgi:hypothetical protein